MTSTFQCQGAERRESQANLQQVMRGDEAVALRDIWELAKNFPAFAGILKTTTKKSCTL